MYRDIIYYLPKDLQGKGVQMIRQLKQADNGISGLEFLLDETICQGDILVEKSILIGAGGINPYLETKQKYELLVRLAFEKPIVLEDADGEKQEDYILLIDDEKEIAEQKGWKTDCYITGRYSKQLLDAGLLDDVITAIVAEADGKGRKVATITFLEQMIAKKESYWRIVEGSCPILIYRGDDICHNVLNVFADQFGNALTQAGRNVIYFDCAENEPAVLTKYMHQHFQAIIGVQTYLFSIKMQDGVHYLHEYLYGPKYNFVFDHPVWMLKHMKQHYVDFYILTHDANYVIFTKRYFKQNALLFPPAGILGQEKKQSRIYDLTFIGTYGNYWNEVLFIHQMERKKRFLANRFLLVMRKNPTYTAEQALEIVLQKRGMNLSDEEFLNLLYELRRVIYCVMHYYRDRVLREILADGIRVDVFGDSWNNCPLVKYSNLVCHPNVTVEESLDIWRQSKLSLNIMSWHKGGFTERMANIMLAGAVLVTDTTTYLHGRYTQEELVSFSLEQRKQLPDKIKELLRNDALRYTIAQNGKNKTMKEHTWKRRAEQFMEILMERQTNEESKCDSSLL